MEPLRQSGGNLQELVRQQRESQSLEPLEPWGAYLEAIPDEPLSPRAQELAPYILGVLAP